MHSDDLHLFRSYGRAAFGGNGDVFAALSTPDIDDDRYTGVIHRLRPDGAPVPFTVGPRDSDPVTSPGGEIMVFLRADGSGPAQLFAMPCSGGEPFPLAVHPLGASSVAFSPDGRSIAYLAAVPEAGRYGLADGHDGEAQPVTPAGSGAAAPKAEGRAPDAESPRRITRMAYRLDGRGFVGDKAEQIFILNLLDESGHAVTGSVPRRLTEEHVPVGRPAFTPDGSGVVYQRAAAPDSQQSEIALIATDRDTPGLGDAVVAPRGDATAPVVYDGTLYYIGTEFDGNDFAGRTPGLWSVPLAGGEPRRLTDPETVHIEAAAGEISIVGDRAVIAVAERGAVRLRAVPLDVEHAALDELPVIVGGRQVVRDYVVRGDRVAATVADPLSCGDIVVATVDTPPGSPAPGSAGQRSWTDVSAPLRAAGLAEITELAGASSDGYPVHGFLVLPPADLFPGPHPVLLDIHGGPHAAYGWGVFDEAQLYATNGYAVVLPNPRGSSGYGQAHGRAIVGALGTVDADDVLALLDIALQRGDVAADRVGVMGGSYGGFMTSWLASHAADRFVAGISERAVNAWDSFMGSSDIGYFFADAYVGTDPGELRARSPLYHAADIGIPLLIIHSEHDWRCPIEQAQRLFVALTVRGHQTEMLLFPGEGHELSRSGRPRHRKERFDAILDWWRRYLPASPAAIPPLG